ncbi:MAG TPA: phosphoenolpyruvate synthase [Cytophagaceae bacterium]|jgi:pyruvate,water dikinase|nr:phosphoenolpyruvate synthase [Cytophagaceae bacterium]
MDPYIKKFSEISIGDLVETGGKNASLGEMFTQLTSKGVNIPDGFAVTSTAYWYFIERNELRKKLTDVLSSLDTVSFANLSDVGAKCRGLILNAHIPDDVQQSILEFYHALKGKYNREIELAVRSSATAEDLANASFAGQQESYLNIKGEKELLDACLRCYASLFTDRAIKYRFDHQFEHMKVALSIGIQTMVRSDLASAGVGFTLDPETGFRNVVYLTGSWGLGENVVQGAVNTDEFYIFKPALKNGKKSILSRKLGNKAITMVYATDKNSVSPTLNLQTPEEKRKQFILTEKEIEQLAKWFVLIEEHYQKPMDIEWAKDGISNELYIVQARPETVHSQNTKRTLLKEYTITEKKPILTKGVAIGKKIATGIARVLNSPSESEKLKEGEVLVTGITNPDWDPILKKAAAIITDKGGRTSHAAIVAREVGAVAVVGTANATSLIKDGEIVTVSCIEGNEGFVYEGAAKWEEKVTDLTNIELPDTSTMYILGDPEKAFELAMLPNNGVGLLRLEFIVNNSIKAHPMALVHFDDLKDEKAKKEIAELTAGYEDKEKYFVEKLAEAIAIVAAAFYPKDVIVRMSDFKTNEYANLLGGKQFEPKEENPMIGFRGASRYYNERYREGFRLECEAMKVVRNEMGLDNIKLMIPFCRTVEEGKKVLDIMSQYGLHRGENNLEVYVMAEIPSNVILAEEFAEIFDGFSIGSNDLTQLTLGLDRDSSIVQELFDENNLAVKRMIEMVITKAKAAGRKIGICGQGPSDSESFAQFLVEAHIDSISFNPDAMLHGMENIKKAEYNLVMGKIV